MVVLNACSSRSWSSTLISSQLGAMGCWCTFVSLSSGNRVVLNAEVVYSTINNFLELSDVLNLEAENFE